MKKAIALTAAALMCTGLVGCGSAAKTYTEYVQSVLDCSYYGITDKYMEMTDSTQEEADAVFQDEIDYFAQVICYSYGVEMDYISEETMDGYTALAEDVVKKVKYTVDPAEISGDSYHITVHCEPIDFWDLTEDAVESYYIDEFEEKYLAFETEDELAALEEEYAVNVLEILSGYVSQIGYKESVKKIVEITVDDDGLYGIEDQDWLDIDDLLLDLDVVE